MIAVPMVAGMLALVIGIGILRAFVLRYLWLWFVVPLGAHPLSLAHAFGIALLVGMFTSSIKRRVKKDKPEATEAFAAVITTLAETALSLLIALGIGWVAASFMP